MADNDQISSSANDGFGLYEAGKLAEAIPALQAHLSIVPHDVAAIERLAVCYLQTGKPHQAVIRFLEMIGLQPTEPRHSYNLARTYEAMGDPTRSRAAYQRALRLDSSYKQAQEKLTALEERFHMESVPMNGSNTGVGASQKAAEKYSHPDDDRARQLAAFCHLIILIPYAGLYAVRGIRRQYGSIYKLVDDQARESMNSLACFALYLLGYLALMIVLRVFSILLFFTGWSQYTESLMSFMCILPMLALVWGFVLHFVAAWQARRGIYYRYPLTKSLIK